MKGVFQISRSLHALLFTSQGGRRQINLESIIFTVKGNNSKTPHRKQRILGLDGLDFVVMYISAHTQYLSSRCVLALVSHTYQSVRGHYICVKGQRRNPNMYSSV